MEIDLHATDRKILKGNGFEKSLGNQLLSLIFFRCIVEFFQKDI